MKLFFSFLVALLCGAVVLAQTTDEPTEPTPEPSSPAPPETSTGAPPESTTTSAGQPYGALCNGLLLRCNRYSETVACLQRRPDPTTTTTTEESEPPTSDNPIIAMFQKRSDTEPKDICETGIGVDLGRCQCRRNCKDGVYVDDGMFDENRQICVGLVGSTCSLLVPNCVPNGHCNFFASTCVCDSGYVADENRRCVPRK